MKGPQPWGQGRVRGAHRPGGGLALEGWATGPHTPGPCLPVTRINAEPHPPPRECSEKAEPWRGRYRYPSPPRHHAPPHTHRGAAALSLRGVVAFRPRRHQRCHVVGTGPVPGGTVSSSPASTPPVHGCVEGRLGTRSRRGRERALVKSRPDVETGALGQTQAHRDRAPLTGCGRVARARTTLRAAVHRRTP